jgi:hypothetical protein
VYKRCSSDNKRLNKGLETEAAKPLPSTLYSTTCSATGNFENLAIRPNGNVLVTRFDIPQLWKINPSDGSGSLAHAFQSPSTSVILGITEYERDFYTLGGGTINQTTLVGKPGTWAI